MNTRKNVLKQKSKCLKLMIVFISLFFSQILFSKPQSQATCGLGSGGGNLNTGFKYQNISNYIPFRIDSLSKKVKSGSGEYLQQYRRIIHLELTNYPGDKDNGSQFAVISVEDGKTEE